MAKRKIVVGHRATREIAFVGPVGVGKTTAVRALSSIEAASTDVLTTAGRQSGRRAAGRKTTTTVALDYGEWRSDRGTVTLYGTPGQVRFRSSRDRVMPASTAIALLLYGNTSYALEEAEEWLYYIGAANLGSRLTVVVTRLGQPAEQLGDEVDGELVDDFADKASAPEAEELDEERIEELLQPYRALAAAVNPEIGVMAGDPRDREDVARIVSFALRSAPAASPRIIGTVIEDSAAGGPAGMPIGPDSARGEARA